MIWKNSFIRHNSQMRRISPKFRPEDPDYETSVMTTPMVIHVFACIFLLFHLSFSIALMIIGRKKVRSFLSNFNSANWKINISVFLVIITLILWLSSSIMLLISSAQSSTGLKEFEQNSYKGVSSYINAFKTIDGNVKYINVSIYL